MKFYVSLVLLFLFADGIFAQDTILFMDGKEKVCKVQLIDDAKEIVVYNQGEDAKYIYAKTYEKYEVMYVRFGNTGRKRYIYTYDTAIGNIVKVKDMERFVLGEQYSKKYYHTPLSAVFGLAIGAVGGLTLRYYSLLAPPIGYFLVNIKRGRKPHDKGLVKYPPSLIVNDFFINGYREMAKRKKSKMALLGGLVGSISSIAIYEAFIKK